MNIGRAHPPDADDLDPQVIEGSAVFESATAIVQTLVPLSKGNRGRVQMADRPPGPPQIAERLEAGEGALTRFDRLAQLASDQVDLGQQDSAKALISSKPAADEIATASWQ